MDSLPAILLLLAASVFAVVMLRRIGMPSILGYLLVGILLGPHVLHLVDDTAGIRHLAEFGIVFLMFTIGLEFSLPRLYAMKRIVFGLGLLQVLTAIGVALGLALLTGLSWQAGVALGGALAMSSTAVLTKLYPTRSHTGAAQGGMCAALANVEDDNWEWHTFDTVKGGDYLADQDAVEVMCKEAIDAVLDLEKMGMPFNRTPEGRIDQRRFGGHTRDHGKAPVRRACYAADRTGHMILQTLYQNCVKHDVEFFNEFYAIIFIRSKHFSISREHNAEAFAFYANIEIGFNDFNWSYCFFICFAFFCEYILTESYFMATICPNSCLFQY